MKKLLLLALTTVMLVMGMTSPLIAQNADECPCGEDDMGECLPCDQDAEE